MKIFLDLRGPSRGGSWTYTQSLLPHMISTGHDLTVLYDSNQKQLPLQSITEEVFPHCNKIRWMLWSHFSLPKRLASESFNLYHSFKQLNAFRSKTKQVYTFHTAGPFVYPHFYKRIECLHWQYMFRKSAQKGDAVIVCSEYDREMFADKARISAEKIHVTHLGVDQQFKQIPDAALLDLVKERYHLPQRFILFVGTLYPFKNVPSLIKAFSRCVKELDDYHLVITGGKGWYYDEIFKLVDELGLSDKILFTGPVLEALPAVYNLADLFVFPSVYESFGLPVIEAMACGTPVIISDRGALPEIAGEAAICVDPDDTGAFAKTITDVLSSGSLREDLRKKGLERSKLFTWEKCAEKTLKVYEDIIR